MSNNILKNSNRIYIGIFLMLLSSLNVCFGQLLWKISAINNNLFSLVCGFGFYGMGALLMIIAYRFGPLSILQPILSANYILSIIIGSLVFNETVTLIKWIGVCFIIMGVCFIARGASH